MVLCAEKLSDAPKDAEFSLHRYTQDLGSSPMPTASTIMAVLGYVLQASGLVITLVGVVRTWSVWATEPFLTPLTDFLGTVRKVGKAAWSRASKRWRDPTVHLASAQIEASTSLEGRGRLSDPYSEISEDASPDKAIKELGRRTEDLRHSVRRLERVLENLQKDFETRDDVFSARLDQIEENFEAMGARVAMSGIRYEVLGLTLIILGLVLVAAVPLLP